MRILVVSQYYPPEVGATQNRMGAFVDGLAARGHRVTVVCEQPNHPAGVFADGYGRRPVVTTTSDGVVVHRLWVAASPRKSTARRLAFYGTFAAGAAAAVAAVTRHDVVFATSPPLPGAVAAVAAARARRTPVVLDVRDLWPAAAEALGELSQPRVIAALGRAERWAYRTARAVTATTEPFCAHIDRVAGIRRAVHVPNGALDELVRRTYTPPPAGPFTVGYAGNLGIAQGLDAVLDAASGFDGTDARFVLVGAGPLRQRIEARVAGDGLRAVELRSPVPTDRIGDVLEGFGALLVPLRAHPVLADFIPSKLYDAMAVGRPAIVAASGEPARLVERIGCGVVVPPEDPGALAEAVRRLAADPESAARMGRAGKEAAGHLARSRQVERLERVLAVAAGRA